MCSNNFLKSYSLIFKWIYPILYESPLYYFIIFQSYQSSSKSFWPFKCSNFSPFSFRYGSEHGRLNFFCQYLRLLSRFYFCEKILYFTKFSCEVICDFAFYCFILVIRLKVRKAFYAYLKYNLFSFLFF